MTLEDFYLAKLIIGHYEMSDSEITDEKMGEFKLLAKSFADSYSAEGLKRDRDLIDFIKER